MYRLTQEVAKMMEYIGEHPVSLMVLEAFGEIQISDKIKEVLQFTIHRIKHLGMKFSVIVTAWTLRQEHHTIYKKTL